jgi:aspartate-semialdehyde dehydrogenase
MMMTQAFSATAGTSASAPDKGYQVAVLGATGLVGSKIVHLLEERAFPMSSLRPLASARSVGGSVLCQGQSWPVQEATERAFEGIDLVLASAGASISQQLVPAAIKAGAVVVDNTSYFRLMPDVPLVVAGVNDDDLRQHQGIIANPNCSTAQLMPVLHALRKLSPIQRVVISTYQSVSGAGKKGLDELLASTEEALDREDQRATHHHVFQRPIAFNLVPQIDKFITEPGETYGYTKEEAKLMLETRKILHLPHLRISATAVRVPVMVGHSEAVHVSFSEPVSPEAAVAALQAVPEVVVTDDMAQFATPLEVAGLDPVYVSRIRRDAANPETGLCFWVVADNLRIGAALNAVRIAEKLDAMALIPQQKQRG